MRLLPASRTWWARILLDFVATGRKSDGSKMQNACTVKTPPDVGRTGRKQARRCFSEGQNEGHSQSPCGELPSTSGTTEDPRARWKLAARERISWEIWGMLFWFPFLVRMIRGRCYNRRSFKGLRTLIVTFARKGIWSIFPYMVKGGSGFDKSQVTHVVTSNGPLWHRCLKRRARSHQPT